MRADSVFLGVGAPCVLRHSGPCRLACTNIRRLSCSALCVLGRLWHQRLHITGRSTRTHKCIRALRAHASCAPVSFNVSHHMRFLCCALTMACISGQALAANTDTHCLANEHVYFSCGIDGSDKVVSLCGGMKDSQPSWLQYRFGAIGHTELTYPKARRGRCRNSPASSRATRRYRFT